MRFILVMIAACIVIYFSVVRNKICRAIIKKRIANRGLELKDITMMNWRDPIYAVTYKDEGVIKKTVVTFNLFYEEYWY